MNLPKSIQDVVDAFEMLPGIGPKTAQRLAFYLLRIPEHDINRFSKVVADIKQKTKMCKNCFNVADSDLCDVCADHTHDDKVLCVVETPLDVIALEKSGYRGLYHVLHGAINPLAGIGPEEIYLNQLLARVDERMNSDNPINEIILATSTSLEGESTAMYIHKELTKRHGISLKISRIGKGLPIGADIEFADEQTLNDALQGRVSY